MTSTTSPYVDGSATSIDPAIDPARNYFVPVWDAVLAAVPAWRVMVDVGCGNGVFAEYARLRTGCRVWGVDGDPDILGSARASGRFERVEQVADLNSDPLPFEDASCDFVLCKDVLEHMMRPDHVVREIRRILAPGGHALVHVPNHFPIHGRLKFVLTNDIDTYDYFPGSEVWSFPHVRFFTDQSLRRLLDQSQLRTVRDLSWNFPVVPYLPVPASVRRRLAARWPSQWAGGFTILCRKS